MRKFLAKFYRKGEVVRTEIIEGWTASYEPWVFSYCFRRKINSGFDDFTYEEIKG